MSYSLRLTATGLTKIAAALGGGDPVEFAEMVFGSSIPDSTPDVSIENEVARVAVSLVEPGADFVDVSGQLASDVGGFFIQGVYIVDAADDVVAVGEFPTLYKPQGAEGGVATLNVKARVALENIEDGVVTVNIGAGAVKYDEPQELTTGEQQQAVANIGLSGTSGGVKIVYDSGGFPWLAIKNLTTGEFSPIATTGTGSSEAFAIVTLP